MRMGILDGFIGKVGTVIGSFWKGKKLMRGYNEFPSNPKTPSQKLQRAKFALLGVMGGALLKALQIGLRSYADKRVSTEVGEFVRLNLGNVSGTVNHLEVDYEELILSKGGLTPVSLGEANFSTPKRVGVPIENGYINDKVNSANDKVYLVVYNTTLQQAMISDGSTTRSDSEVKLDVPGNWQGDYVEVWAFVKAADNTPHDPEAVSTTIYAGTGTIA
ncbi:MAG: hypothetical protein J6X79_07880 [Bacteroidales bacterium]|nr:hypothetical protein [Bacteroidales bacterium]